MISLYAGSFDPITKGHEYIISFAPGDKLIIAVANDPNKKYMFSLDERIDLVSQSLFPRQKGVDVFINKIGNNYLVNYAKEIGANYIIRGVRSAADYEAEKAYADVNRVICGKQGPIHLLIMPPPYLASVSSSIVKSLIGYDHWEDAVSHYVSPHVLEALQKKSNANTNPTKS